MGFCTLRWPIQGRMQKAGDSASRASSAPVLSREVLSGLLPGENEGLTLWLGLSRAPGSPSIVQHHFSQPSRSVVTLVVPAVPESSKP